MSGVNPSEQRFPTWIFSLDFCIWLLHTFYIIVFSTASIGMPSFKLPYTMKKSPSHKSKCRNRMVSRLHIPGFQLHFFVKSLAQPFSV